jgi:cell division protein ZapA (FtsZ GTPase activity inhibitor)
MLQIRSMAKDRPDHRFEIKVTRSAAAESGEVSALTNRRLAKLDITLEKGIAMLSKEVQELVDKTRKQTDYIKSVDAAVAALKEQNGAMKAKIEEIANQPPKEVPADDSGTAAPVGSEPTPTVVYSLSDEDKQALLDVAKELDEALNTLKDDIPANVEVPEAQEAAQDPQSGSSSGEAQPEVPNPQGHAQDAEAASQAKPLDGTGAPAEEQKQDPGA